MSEPPLKVTVVDYGVKRNILRLLTTRGCHVRVVPCDARGAMCWREPGRVVFSPGPGDPANWAYAEDDGARQPRGRPSWAFAWATS